MPPPPPEPPPLPRQHGGVSNARGKSMHMEPPPDRNALLSQIRKGARLKIVETNDRSIPLIDGAKSSVGAKRNLDYRANGPAHVIPPGGLFAQGIPKLRPTIPRCGDASEQFSAFPTGVRSSNNSSSLDHLRVGQVSGSRSQPHSPVSKPRQSSGSSPCRTPSLSSSSENSSGLVGNPNFPDDINIKGPAPPPPPANQKPCFRANVAIVNDGTQQKLNTSAKHTAVRRSASQTNLGQRPRLSRPPPNVRPPPPPKSNSAPQNAPPPPPSKPPSILRRQSFGIGETHASRFASNKLTVANASFPKVTSKTIGPPPPPPRNNSAPNDLNEMTSNFSSGIQLNKMCTAPPPPPPNRTAVIGNRAPPIRPPPPRAPAPPPPQHRFPAHPAPPSQMKATPPLPNLAPPPPARISSIKQTSEFEGRFLHMFTGTQDLPKPERFTNCEKSYPSKVNRSKQKLNLRRQPPPPPPIGSGLSDGSRGQPVLHIQLESCIFANNVAHC